MYPYPVQGNTILPDKALFASAAGKIGLPHLSRNHMYMKPRCSSNCAEYTVQFNKLSVFIRPNLSKEKDQSDLDIF